MISSLFFLKADRRLTLIIYSGLIIQLVTAFFSVGYNHPDEHWQLLEFANFKLGLSSADQLPWEYAAQSRSCFQPLVVYLIGKLMMMLGIYNPLHLALILRLISSVLSWFCSLLLIKYATEKVFRYQNDLKEQNSKPESNQIYLLAAFAFFTWFVPYIHCRFSGENWSGIFFFFGLITALNSIDNEKGELAKALGLFLAGLFFGLAYLNRFQIAFAAIGFGCWLLFFTRIKFSGYTALILGGLILMVIGFVIDYWYFGVWTSTAYNYFHAQIISNAAAAWGETPWWDYFLIFFISVGPPLSLLYLILIGLSIYSNPKHPFTWILVFFVAGHMLIGHKEERFLFPMVYLLPMLLTLWWKETQILSKISKNIFIKILLVIVLIENSALLLTVMFFKPANESVSFYNYVYAESKGKHVTLLTLDVNPYKFGHLDNNFYKPADLEIIKLDSIQDIIKYVPNDNRKVYFFDNHFNLNNENMLNEVKLEAAYKTIPEWLSYFNFNNWMVRARVWSLYEVKYQR